MAKSNGKKHDFLVVGIGASAGGVSALKEFFAKMPDDSGMAFVVVLHLSDTHESHLAQILQLNTRMKVRQVQETVKVKPDNVYVIPPAKHLRMEDGTLALAEPERIRGKRVPIDFFFRTLADAYGQDGVAVILSGTGSDGTLGLRRIKETGGIAIAQEPAEAEYDGMPRSAIATGLVDMVLPIEKIPSRLIAFRQTAEKIQLPKDEEKPPEEISGDDVLREILLFLRIRTGHDFSNYKQATLLRRIARRLQVHGLTELEAYLNVLREDPNEPAALQRDLLITVTNFFRDKEAFEELEKTVIPHLFAGKSSSDHLRVWSVGCATGEEAFSISMLLHEYAALISDPPRIQVFASDINEDAIAFARAGYFEETIVADVTPERLRRFFIKEGTSYRIKKEIRDSVLFAPHNILRDPPFSKMDLITCRNLLIYFNRETQEKVLAIFHFALRYEGFLFLGSSESAETSETLFSPLDKKHRIYKTRPAATPQRMLPPMPLLSKWEVKLREVTAEIFEQPAYGEIHYKLVEQLAPPSVLVNDQYEIVHVSENAGQFLRFTAGEPSRNLLKVISPDLKLDVQAALLEASQGNRTGESGSVRVTLNGKEKFINISVRFIESTETKRGFYLVTFDEAKNSTPSAEESSIPQKTAGRAKMDEIVRRLEEELIRTKDRLRTTIEQHETSIEELRASNEELQAINEELRSATEELETSKEELQSVNEELTTVNHENKEKLDEISGANSDLQNLMASTNIGTIFLDRALNIKFFTPPAADLFNIISSDIGRPLDHLTNKLHYEFLAEDAEEVLRTLKVVEREMRSHDGNHYIARFLPYRTIDDHIRGVVMTFVDNTERKHVEEELRVSHERKTEILESIHEAFYAVDEHFNFTYVNKKAEELWNRKRETLIGKHFWTEFPAAVGGESYEMHLKVMKERVAVHFETVSTLLGRWVEVVIYPDTRGGLSCYFRDISERKQTEESLRFQSQLLGTVEQSVIATDLTGTVTFWNKFAEKLFGWTAREATGRNIIELTTPEIAADQAAQIMSQLRQGQSWSGEFNVQRRDGTIFPAQVFNSPIYDGEGVLIGVVGVSIDISERKRTEEELRKSEERLSSIMESVKDYAIIVMDANGRIESWNEGAERIFRFTEAEAVGQSGEIIFTPEDRAAGAPELEMKTAREQGRAPDERWHIRKDGSRLYVSGVMTALYNNDKLAGYVKIARDLTESKRIEEVLKETDKRKDEFLATLAHELRNPLAPVRSGLEIINRTGCDEETLRSTLKIIERQTSQIIHLVDDLLDISRISQGKIKLRREIIELRAAIELALETSEGYIEKQNHQLTITLPEKPLYINADLTRIAQVILNLLNNAAKYTQPGGEIWLEAKPEGNEVVLCVRDTGIGIPPEMLSRIFEMFGQVVSVDEQPQSGLGIGLSLVKKLVDMHGGSVRAESEGEGQGSEFIVRLPISEPPKMREPAKPKVAPPLKPAKSRRILVVDDNADAVKMMEVLLSLEGHEVQTAADGKTALQTAEKFVPEVILLDIGLPEMNGYEVARRLREKMPSVLLIAISGWGQDEDRRRSKESGFDHHLVKPVEFDELDRLLNNKTNDSTNESQNGKD